MIDAIRSLFRGAPDAPAGPDPLHLAACALLVEVAYADGAFSDVERAHLEAELARRFGLAEEAGRELIALAEEDHRESIDHFRHTSVLQRTFGTAQKTEFVEAMWRLALADGPASDQQHYLTRKVANLLDLPPRHVSAAKKKVEEAGHAGRTRTG